MAVAISAAFAAPLIQGRDPTFGLATVATHEGWLAPSRFFRVILGHLGHAVGGHVGQSVVETTVRVVFPLVFVAAFVAIVRFVVRRAAVLGAHEQGAAWGWALLAATLAGPVLLPWYIVWTLPVVWLLPRVPRSVAVVTSAVLAASQTVAAAVRFPTIFHGTLFVGHYILTPILFVAFVLLLRDLRSRLTSGAGLGEPTGSMEAAQQQVSAAPDRG